MIEDILLFPYRLVYAIFQFLNFFTVRYTARPLSNSGPTRQKEPDLRQMILWGNQVEAKGMQGDSNDGKILVPSSWELCRKRPSGEIAVLAGSVSSFDVDNVGDLIYSNGVSIFHLSRDGQKKRLHKTSLIQQVIALPDALSKASASENAEQFQSVAEYI